jgi:uncharacterized protein (TIGR03000 family)
MGKGGGGGMPKGGPPPGGGRYPGGYYGGAGYGGFYGGGIILNFPLYGGYGYGAPYRFGYAPLYYDDYPLGDMYYPPPQYLQPSYVQQEQVPARYATIRVLLPDANAKVWFDGNETKQSGAERYFYMPDLDPKGGPYSYRIRAAWKEGEEPMVQERVVEVSPGKTALADFR